MIKEFFVHYFFHVLELLAAIAGTIFIIKARPKGFIRYVVILLWVTFFVELVAQYAAIAYYSDYRYFSFVKNTPFERNYWLFNIFTIFQIFIYTYFFRLQLDSRHHKKILDLLLLLFFIAGLGSFFFEDWFFKSHSPISFIVGSFVLFSAIGFYYLEILRTDKILVFYRLLPFYFSVGLLIFFLCTTPLFIYSTYFSTSSPNYVRLHHIVLYIVNFIMYGMFIVGFVKGSRQRSYLPE